MSNQIIERRYYALEVKTISPINVSSGISEITDSDVLRNGDGEFFVPGTSLAGAFRNYFHQKKDEKSAFGFSQKDDGRMSSIFVSDLYFSDTPQVSVRDGIKLDEQKQSENKFDLEIIETGAEGIIYLNTVCREKEDWNYCSIVNRIIQGIAQGEIRIGANKNRGFGRLAITNIYESVFTADNVDKWLSFIEGKTDISRYSTAMTYKEWLAKFGEITYEYVKIHVPLTLQGGISIRRYSTEPNKADYEHLFCNGVPVIPGSSWNGAIRSEAAKILEEIGLKKSVAKQFIEEWFGYIEKKDSRQSRVIIGESVLKNSVSVPMTRNSINRFSAATRTGALYTDISCFGGKTVLEIMVPKAEDDYKAFIGIMLLVIKDIQKGYLSIGGQAAIGRGIFEADEANEITFSEEISETECLKELYEYLSEVE